MAGSGQGPSGRAGSGRGAFRQSGKWSVGPPAGSEAFGGLCGIAEVVGGPPVGLEVFGGPCGIARSGWEALRQGRKWPETQWNG